MSNLDKGYIVSVDLTLEKRNDTLNFNLADNMTSDIFIKLTNKNIEIDNTLNKVFYLFILNPNKDLQYVLLTKKDSYFYANIPNELKTLKGYYKCQVLVQDLCSKEQVLSQTKFKYRVKSDIVSEVIEDDEQSLTDYSLLTKMIFRLKDLEDTEEERVQAEIQRQTNEVNRQDTFSDLILSLTGIVEDYENKITTEVNRAFEVQDSNFKDRLKNIIDTLESQNKAIEEQNKILETNNQLHINLIQDNYKNLNDKINNAITQHKVETENILKDLSSRIDNL